MSPNPFPGLIKLQVLNLGDNNITADMFTVLPSLREQHAQLNNISLIQSAAFANLPALKKLTLQNNNLGTVQQNMFGLDECPDEHPVNFTITLYQSPL